MPGFLTIFSAPAILAGLGTQKLTKAVLFPARLLYTLSTGAVGSNRAAGEHYAQSTGGARAALVEAAMGWRDSTDPPGETAVALLQGGLAALYAECVEAHITYLHRNGRGELAQALSEWRDQLPKAPT